MIKSVLPVGDRVLIKPIVEDSRVGAILIADLGHEKPEMGEIIAIGEGRPTEAGGFVSPKDFNLAVGQVVLIPKIGTTRIEVDREEYYITPFKEILAVVDYSKDE